MGSLMGGWNSPALKNKQGDFERSSSFTNNRIDEFWNKHKLAQQEHHKAASALAIQLKTAQQDNVEKVEGSVEQGDDGEAIASVEEELESRNSYKDWWTKSTWAFLNEPAMKRMEAASYKYQAQFNVANPVDKALSAPSSPQKY